MQKQFSEGKIAFSMNGAGTIGHPYTKKLKLDLNLIYFKMNHRFNQKTENYKSFKRKHRRKISKPKSM